MSTLGRYIRVLVLLIFSVGVLFAGKLSMNVSSKYVAEGDSVKVTLSAKSKDVKFPDVVDVGGFPVFNTGASSEYSLQSNGQRTTMGYSKSYTFSFYPEVNMTLPEYSVMIDGKEYKTKPVKIVVSKDVEGNKTSGSSSKYRLKLITNKNEVYLGDSCMVDVEFFEPLGANIARAEYNQPRFKNADVKVLDSGKTRRSANGVTHIYSYLVTPRKEGEISISAPSVSLATRGGGRAIRDPFGGMYGGALKWKSIKANSLKIKVLPQMQSSDLVGTFIIKTKLNKGNFKANEPIEYRVVIQGDGELDSLIDHKFEIDGVTSYGDDAVVTYKKDGDKLRGKYVKKYVFISDNSFVIPSFEVTYFDPKEKIVKVLKTSEQSIEVNGQKVTKSSIPKSLDNSKKNIVKIDHNKTEPKVAVNSVLEDSKYYEDKKSRPTDWYMMAMYFGIGLLMLVGVYWLFRKVKNSTTSQTKYSTDDALKILYPHVGKSSEIEEMVATLYEVKNGKSSKKIDKKRLAELVNEVRDI